MTFLSTFCLHAMIGIMVPYIIILGLVIPEIRNKKYKYKRKASGMKLKDWLGVVILFGVIMALSVLTWVETIPLYRDLPSLIFQRYEVKTGIITKLDNESDNSGKTWGFDYIYVDGEKYIAEDLSLNTTYQEITLYYLKHSKYVVKVKDYSGEMIEKTFSVIRFLIFFIIHSLIMALILRTYLRDKKKQKINIPKRTIQAFVSYNIISILIMILEGYDHIGKLSSLFVVMLTNALFHTIHGFGGIRRNIA